MMILIVPSWYKNKGNKHSGSFFYEQAKMLKKCGYDVIIANATLQGKNSIKSNKNLLKMVCYDDNGILTYSFVAPSFGLYRIEPIGKWIFKFCLKRIVKKIYKSGFKIDLIHAHSVYPAAIVCKEIAKKNNCPLVVTEHNSLVLTKNINKIRTRYLREVVEYSDAFICVSDALKKSVTELTKTKKTIYVVPNLVSDLFRYVEPQRDGYFTYVSIGNLVESKNFILTLNAFALTKKRISDCILIVVGDGPLKTKLYELAKELGISDSVVFTGAVEREEVASILQKSNVMVLPSSHETFGVVYIEALACGRPIIATNNGGVNGIIDAQNGIKIDSFDSKILSDAMCDIYQNYWNYDFHRISQKAIFRYGSNSVFNMLQPIYSKVKKEEHK